MANKTEKVSLLFDYERDGKNTVRFTERHEDKEPAVGKLYMKKGAYSRLGKPDCLVVEITRGH